MEKVIRFEEKKKKKERKREKQKIHVQLYIGCPKIIITTIIMLHHMYITIEWSENGNKNEMCPPFKQ